MSVLLEQEKIKMKKLILIPIFALFAFPLMAQKISPEEAFKNDIAKEYKPKPFPTADEVLDGKWEKMLPESKLYPKNIKPVQEGFAEDRLSKVPAPGVHPRVVLSPSDIERIKRFVFMGDAAPPEFQQAFAELKKKADQDGNEIKEYAPWVGPCSGIACKALLAQITGNEAMGKEAAALTVEHAKKMLELLKDWDTQEAAKKYEVKNMYNASPSHSMSIGLEYDYAYPFMTETQRDEVRDAIAQWTAGRYTSFMEMPDHYLINNHWGFAMNWWVASLAIEGEKGWDPRVGKVGADKVYAYVTSSLSPDGMMFEGQKPNLPPYPMLATMRRNRDLAKHPHLHAFTTAALNSIWWKEGDKESRQPQEKADEWKTGRIGYQGLGDEIRIYPAEMMKFFYPENPMIELAWSVHGGPKGSAQGHFTGNDLRLLATTGLFDRTAKFADLVKNGLPKTLTDKVPLTWYDLLRGALRTRSGWGKDDTILWFENKSDYFSSGHEVAECNNFLFASHGIPWTPYAGRYQAPKQQNMILIDGLAAARWTTIPGVILGVYDTPDASAVTGDATDPYNWQKKEKLMEGWHPMLEVYGNQWLSRGGSGIGRDWELPFSTPIRKFNEGFAHLEWGNWHGETRGPERYRQWNEVQRVIRTVQLARGKHPYILVIDDVKKDDQTHKFDWVMNMLRRRLELIKAEKDDLLFGVKGSDAQLLVRVLYRNTGEQIIPPSYTQDQVVVSTAAVEPEFRILIYPHKKGDNLPQTVWSTDRARLSVLFLDQSDTYHFGKAENERTVFALERDGKIVQTIDARPPKPELTDIEDWYGTSMSGTGGNKHSVPLELRDNVFVFSDSTQVEFKQTLPGGEIRYSMDGSEPTQKSPIYTHPLSIQSNTVVKAKTFQRGWMFGKDNSSPTLTATYQKLPMEKSQEVPGDLKQGLECQVFEAVRTIYDKNGFFTGRKEMMVDLSDREPRLKCLTQGIEVPRIPPLAPERRMSKAFYLYQGYLKVEKGGLYKFKIHAPGPVVLKIDDKTIISVTGQYYLSSRDRFGAIPLQAGLHKVEFTFCDPVFYRGRFRQVFKDYGHGGTVPIAIYYEPPLKVSFETMIPGAAAYQPVPVTDFLCKGENLTPFLAGTPEKAAAVDLKDPKPGLILYKYDLSEDIAKLPDEYINYPRNFLEVQKKKPFSEEVVKSLIDNAKRDTKELYEYRGYLYVPADGGYSFETDPAGINQLVIGNVEVQNSRLKGDFPLGQIELKAGYHPISLRIWNSDAILKMKAPGMPKAVQVPMVDLKH